MDADDFGSEDVDVEAMEGLFGSGFWVRGWVH